MPRRELASAPPGPRRAVSRTSASSPARAARRPPARAPRRAPTRRPAAARRPRELALKPPALRIGRLDDPPARGRELLDAGEHLGLEADVARRPIRVAAATASTSAGSSSTGAVMHQHRDRLAVALDRRDRAVRIRPRDARAAGPPRRRSRAPAEPVAELERGVAERAGEPVAQRDRLPQLAEVDDEAGDRRLRPAAAPQVGQQAERDRHEHALVRRAASRLDAPAGETAERR